MQFLDRISNQLNIHWKLKTNNIRDDSIVIFIVP